MATPSHLRQLNQRRVIYALMRMGQGSRADLAKATGMSQPTVGKIVEELLAGRVLDVANGAVEQDPPSPKLGRPGQKVQLDGRNRRFIAVQMGVVNTRLAVLPLAVKHADEWDVEFATPASPRAWVKSLGKAMEKLSCGDLEAMLLSVPGVVDEATGRVLLCPNLRWAEELNLHGLLRDVWPARLLVVQEIRALALGQLAVEPAEEDFLLVDFADGVGGAAVVGGRLFRGSAALSGELGHTPVLGNNRACGRGAVGCVETLVSRRGLLATFATEVGRQDPSWQELVDHVHDKGLQRWLTGALDTAATTIAGAINVLGLHRVVVTGSLVELSEVAVEYLAAAVRRGAMWGRFGLVQCVGAPRRRMAGLVSAAIDRLLCPDVVADEPGEQGRVLT